MKIFGISFGKPEQKKNQVKKNIEQVLEKYGEFPLNRLIPIMQGKEKFGNMNEEDLIEYCHLILIFQSTEELDKKYNLI